MKKLNKKGFTIVELVIVIAVIAILSAVLIPTFSSIIKKAEKSNIDQAAKNAQTEMLAEVDQDLWDDMIVVYVDGDTYYEYKIDANGEFKQDTTKNKDAKTEVASGATIYNKAGAVMTGIDIADGATVTYKTASINAKISVIVPAVA